MQKSSFYLLCIVLSVHEGHMIWLFFLLIILCTGCLDTWWGARWQQSSGLDVSLPGLVVLVSVQRRTHSLSWASQIWPVIIVVILNKFSSISFVKSSPLDAQCNRFLFVLKLLKFSTSFIWHWAFCARWPWFSEPISNYRVHSVYFWVVSGSKQNGLFFGSAIAGGILWKFCFKSSFLIVL